MLVIVVVALVAVWSPWDDGGDGGFEFVAADDVGDDPFTADVAEPVPVDFVELEDDLDAAADEAAPIDATLADSEGAEM